MIGSNSSVVRITKDHQNKHWCIDSVHGITYLSRESSRKQQQPTFRHDPDRKPIREMESECIHNMGIRTVKDPTKIGAILIRPSSPQVLQEQTLLKISAAIFITATTMSSSIKIWLWSICWNHKIRAWMPGSDVTYFSQSVWTVTCDFVPN